MDVFDTAWVGGMGDSGLELPRTVPNQVDNELVPSLPFNSKCPQKLMLRGLGVARPGRTPPNVANIHIVIIFRRCFDMKLPI